MSETTFRERLRRGELLIGTVLTLPSPELAEILSRCGFDWLFIDTEHSATDPARAQAMLQAAGGRCPCLIRVPSADEVWIKKALDMGAAGVIVPQIDTAEAARSVVQLSRYPPEGRRGTGIARAHGYGLDFAGYTASANRQVSVVVQVEHIEAVANIESIARVPGLDAVFVGPYDISASLGKSGQTSDPEVIEAIERIRCACHDAGTRAGIFGIDADATAPYLRQGYTLVAVGLDSLFTASAARQALSQLRSS